MKSTSNCAHHSHMKLTENHKHNIDTVAFLKSNYKYKRRTEVVRLRRSSLKISSNKETFTDMVRLTIRRTIMSFWASKRFGNNCKDVAIDHAHEVTGVADEISFQRTAERISTPVPTQIRKSVRHQPRWRSLLFARRWPETWKRRVNPMPILMALFIALAASVRVAQAGACWQKTLDNGKCNEIYSRNITKEECCKRSPEFSFTENEPTSMEFFFATALGGGMECKPCVESCKAVICEPNKKCAKRKGRPKCICAPECGAAKRRRQRERNQEHHNPMRGHDLAAAYDKSARDIRSLSSEITHINLGLDGAPRHTHTQNQRKLIILQSQSQQKPQISKREPHPRRLIIASNVEHVDQPTTRRLQILSNIGTYSNTNTNTNKHKHRNGRQRNQDAATVEDVRRGSGELSRHKSNKHKNKKVQNELELTGHSGEAQTHNNAGDNKNRKNNNNNGRVRHTHQHSKHEADAPNRAEVESKQRARHQEFQRKRKHNRHSRRKKLKDRGNNNNSTDPTSLGAESKSASVVETSATPAIPMSSPAATKTATQTATTPSNSTSSGDRHFLNHGSNSATSSSSLSSGAPSTPQLHLLPTTKASAAGGLGAGGVATTDRPGGSEFVNSNDITFPEGVDAKFGSYGFPKQPFTETEYETIHSAHPVCGTDGRTYNTECQLRKRACRTDNPNLHVAYRGHCRTTCNGVKCLNGLTCVEDHYTIPHCIACSMACPEDDADERSHVIDPSRAVCGVDGKTYKSICDINRMICKIGRAIAVAYPGPCRADRATCSSINCGPKHTCLEDLLTHEPRCVSCRYKCARKRRPTAHHRYEEGKICGVNNHTYHSWCEMRKDSCATGFFIDVKKPGKCQ